MSTTVWTFTQKDDAATAWIESLGIDPLNIMAGEDDTVPHITQDADGMRLHYREARGHLCRMRLDDGSLVESTMRTSDEWADVHARVSSLPPISPRD